MKKGFRILKFKKDAPIFEVKDLSKSFDGRPVLKKFGSDGSYEIIERLKSRAKVRKKKLNISFGK